MIQGSIRWPQRLLSSVYLTLLSHRTNRTLRDFGNAIKALCFYPFAKPCAHSVHVNQRTSAHANTHTHLCRRCSAVWLQNKPVPSRLGLSLCDNHINHSLTFTFHIPDFLVSSFLSHPINQMILEGSSAALPNVLLIFFFSDGL